MWLGSSINKSKNYPFVRGLGSDQCGDKNSDENHPIDGVMLPYVTGAGLYNGSIMERTLCRLSTCCQSIAATQFVAPSAPALINGGNETFQNPASIHTAIVTKTQYWLPPPPPPPFILRPTPSYVSIPRVHNKGICKPPTFPAENILPHSQPFPLPSPQMFIQSQLSINIWKRETLTLHWSDKTVG